ncbi:MAG: hypothetical protein M3O41_03730 [Pseudomonadota bacterium]|nr:hypothetical protein [Pseudomonadota bacterium]
MSTKSRLLIGGGIAFGLAGLVLATPIKHLASPLFSVGQHPADIELHGRGLTPSGQRFRVELETEGPSTISTQDVAYSVGGVNGWHSHPGMVAVTLISGSLQWFDENCVETDYTAGQSWTEGSQLHYFRVVGTVGIHSTAFFLTAQGAPLRTDETAPACAGPLGLT